MAKYRSFFAVVGFYISSIHCFAQSEIDSLLSYVRLDKKDTTHIRALIQLSVLAEESDFALARHYAEEAIFLAEETKEQKLLLEALHSITKMYRSALINDTALFYAGKAKQLAIKLDDINAQAEINIDVGNIYLNSSNYLEALSQFITAARIFDSLKINPRGQMMAYANIGNIQLQLNNTGKALEYLNRGLSIAKAINFENGVAYSYKAKGRVFRKVNQVDSAIVAYTQALDHYVASGNKWQISEVLHSLGNTYFDKEEYNKAIKNYEESLAIARSISHDLQMAYCYAALGDTWKVLKKNKKAAAYSDSVLVTAKDFSPYLVMDSYYRLAEIAEEENQYQRSLNFFKRYAAMRDSLTTVENRSVAEEMEAKYQNSAKQSQIELLEKDKELHKASQQANIIVGVITLVSVIVISLLLVNRYRVMNRIKRQAELESMRQTIARDLHDDIGSTLSSINIISQMALQEKNGDATHFRHIAQHSSTMMESMSDIVWSINPNNDSLEQVISKMKEFTAEILDPLDIHYSFSGEDDLYAFKLDVSVRKNLFLIFKEAINNAAKYSSASSITIKFKREGDTIHLKISDNGKGFEPLNRPTGNGLRNMKERAEGIRAKLNIKSSPDSGTEVTVLLPLT